MTDNICCSEDPHGVAKMVFGKEAETLVVDHAADDTFDLEASFYPCDIHWHQKDLPLAVCSMDEFGFAHRLDTQQCFAIVLALLAVFEQSGYKVVAWQGSLSTTIVFVFLPDSKPSRAMRHTLVEGPDEVHSSIAFVACEEQVSFARRGAVPADEASPDEGKCLGPGSSKVYVSHYCINHLGDVFNVVTERAMASTPGFFVCNLVDRSCGLVQQQVARQSSWWHQPGKTVEILLRSHSSDHGGWSDAAVPVQEGDKSCCKAKFAAQRSQEHQRAVSICAATQGRKRSHGESEESEEVQLKASEADFETGRTLSAQGEDLTLEVTVPVSKIYYTQKSCGRRFRGGPYAGRYLEDAIRDLKAGHIDPIQDDWLILDVVK
eukprot:CAMPEP_0117572732 /NCGR_PEP_ID=MMETSP0784-20121206/60518_1 /TAXON_ID=39447 /ORGANISM="" /LENGTH=376 /DNA_ID=CAMNT_0005371131 /DNA_START=70 /DNA_END=1197 /DNA_ORIENTATION=-